METKKVDDNQIEVTKIDTKEIKNIFTYEYLVSQKETIQAQKDRDNAQRDLELKEVNDLLAECVILDITVKVLEDIISK